MATAGLFIASGSVYFSFYSEGWRHEVLLNSGFMVLGAIFTALIVDRIVQSHAENRWSDARESAWNEARAVATALVGGIAQFYPDPVLTLNNPSNLTGSERKMTYATPGSTLYSSSSWIRHIRGDAVSGYHEVLPKLTQDQLDQLDVILETSASDISLCLTMFSQLLDPLIIDRMLRLLNSIRSERPLVQVVRSELMSGGGMSSQPRPVFDTILTYGIDIVEEVNQKYPVSNINID